MKHVLLHLLVAISFLAGPASAAAQLEIVGQFASGIGSVVGVGYDPVAEKIWLAPADTTELQSHATSGAFLVSLARPGEVSNDADVEIAPEPLTLGTTSLPEGTLLFIDGETEEAEIYAVDAATGSVLATLATAFGADHVVGGAYHPGRDTFFLVQDNVPSSQGNRIAEVDPATGAVLNAFSIAGLFSVSFGDLEVSGVSGNLFVASSVEARILELTPSGALVRHLALPAGVDALSGIALDDARGEAWVSGTGGTVWRLAGFPRTPIDPASCYRTKDSRGSLCSAESPQSPGAPCAEEEDCGGSSDEDGDETDFCVPKGFVKGVRALVEDRFESAVFELRKPAALCAPADVEGRGVHDAEAHLRAYKIRLEAGRPRHERQRGLEIVNALHPAFGELRVDTVKASRLLLPAAVSRTAPVPAPEPGRRPGALQCYKIKISRGAPKLPKGLRVTVADAFDAAKVYELVKPTQLCTAAVATILPSGAPQPIDDPERLLACYRVRLAKTPPQERHVRVAGAFVRDAVGAEQVDTVKYAELCLPSETRER